VGQIDPFDENAAAYGLSGCQAEIARLAASGRSVKQIAAATRKKEDTVKSHLKRLYRRMRVSSRAEMAKKLCGPAAAKVVQFPRRATAEGDEPST